MQKALIFLFIISINSLSKAVITRLYILCNNKNDYIYLFGDTHSHMPKDDLRQLNLMSDILKHREQVSTEQLDVLVEGADALTKNDLSNDFTVMFKITNSCSELNYTTFYNIETRTIGKIARAVLHPLYHPRRITSKWNFILNGKKIKSKKLTFMDVLDEFDNSLNKLQMAEVKSEAFNEFITKAKIKRDKFLKILEENEIALSFTICDVAKELFYQENDLSAEKRSNNRIRKKILSMNSVILDLYALTTLLSLPSKKKLIITGRDHTVNIKYLLETMGYSTRNTYDYKNDFIPLSEKEFKSIIQPPVFPDFNFCILF